jgi:hypothetical protein
MTDRDLYLLGLSSRVVQLEKRMNDKTPEIVLAIVMFVCGFCVGALFAATVFA